VRAVQSIGEEEQELLQAVERKRINMLDAHTRLADLREQEGDLASAVWELEAAVRLFPVDFRIWVRLGRTRLTLGDVPGAIEAAKSSLYWAPGFPPAQELLRDATARMAVDQAIVAP
jgi:predicted Zn-dependent protease